MSWTTILGTSEFIRHRGIQPQEHPAPRISAFCNLLVPFVAQALRASVLPTSSSWVLPRSCTDVLWVPLTFLPLWLLQGAKGLRLHAPVSRRPWLPFKALGSQWQASRGRDLGLSGAEETLSESSGEFTTLITPGRGVTDPPHPAVPRSPPTVTAAQVFSSSCPPPQPSFLSSFKS